MCQRIALINSCHVADNPEFKDYESRICYRDCKSNKGKNMYIRPGYNLSKSPTDMSQIGWSEAEFQEWLELVLSLDKRFAAMLALTTDADHICIHLSDPDPVARFRVWCWVRMLWETPSAADKILSIFRRAKAEGVELDGYVYELLAGLAFQDYNANHYYMYTQTITKQDKADFLVRLYSSGNEIPKEVGEVDELLGLPSVWGNHNVTKFDFTQPCADMQKAVDDLFFL